MFSIISGSIILSLLHATIPNHWLPVIAIGRKEKWTIGEVTQVTFIAAIAHGLSTIIIGFALGFIGATMAAEIENFSRYIAPLILIALGVLFIYRHHNHKHFHLSDSIKKKESKKTIIIALVLAIISFIAMVIFNWELAIVYFIFMGVCFGAFKIFKK